MPAAYHIDAARCLVTTTIQGTVTDADLAANFAGLTADPAFDPAFDHLVDAREVTELEVTTGAVRRSAQGDPFAPGSRRAVVVSRDAEYGMARMFQALSPHGDDHLLVTRDLDEARRWLGVDS